MNCYLEETISGFSSSFNSGTSALFRVNSKVRFQTSNSAFMALADPSVLVRASVPPPEIWGIFPSLSFLLLTGFRGELRLESDSVPLSFNHNTVCIFLLFLRLLYFILKVHFAPLLYVYSNLFKSLLKARPRCRKESMSRSPDEV